MIDRIDPYLKSANNSKLSLDGFAPLASEPLEKDYGSMLLKK